jgi:hypothetical protein
MSRYTKKQLAKFHKRGKYRQTRRRTIDPRIQDYLDQIMRMHRRNNAPGRNNVTKVLQVIGKTGKKTRGKKTINPNAMNMNVVLRRSGRTRKAVADPYSKALEEEKQRKLLAAAAKEATKVAVASASVAAKAEADAAVASASAAGNIGVASALINAAKKVTAGKSRRNIVAEEKQIKRVSQSIKAMKEKKGEDMAKMASRGFTRKSHASTKKGKPMTAAAAAATSSVEQEELGANLENIMKKINTMKINNSAK